MAHQFEVLKFIGISESESTEWTAIVHYNEIQCVCACGRMRFVKEKNKRKIEKFYSVCIINVVPVYNKGMWF